MTTRVPRSLPTTRESTASAEDRIAWALCQIIDDDAPMRWTRYRSAAVCIAKNPEMMADLKALAAHGVAATDALKRDVDHLISTGQLSPAAGVPAPQPTPYGLAGIEGDAIVIRLTADACAFAFANDPQAQEPRPPVIDKQQFLRDTLNELTSEREDGSTPLTDMLDRAMVKAMENGSDALDHDAADGVKGSE